MQRANYSPKQMSPSLVRFFDYYLGRTVSGHMLPQLISYRVVSADTVLEMQDALIPRRWLYNVKQHEQRRYMLGIHKHGGDTLYV